MQHITMECSLPILSADFTFTSNDSPETARLTAENMHSQLRTWMKTKAIQPNSNRTVRLASGANYALENGEIMHTRLDGEFTLKPGADPRSSLAVAASEKIRDELTVWVMGGARGFGSSDPVFTVQSGNHQTKSN